MFQKTDAIALRITPFSNTSHVVFWLAPELGRIATVIKGSQRPKSPFLGQYDLFYTCEIVYYSKEKNGLHVLKECCPLDARTRFRSDWRASGCASYACDLMWHISGSGGHSKELYALLAQFLNFSSETGARTPSLLWLELKTLNLLGLKPRLDRCSICQNPVTGNRTVTAFAHAGGVICELCLAAKPSENQHNNDKTLLKPDYLAILRNWLDAPSPRSAYNTKCSKDHLFTFSRLMDIFIAFHMDLRLTSRTIALELLS